MQTSDILISTNHQKTLSLLIENGDRSFTEKEIVEATGVSKSGVNVVLRDLEKNSLVIRRKRGRMSFFSIDNSIPLIRELKRALSLAALLPLIQQLKAVSQRIILFGSVAQGTDTSESDIDLFILSGEKDKAAERVRSFKTAKELKPVILTPVEYATSQAKDKAFFQELKKGIVLYEKEAYEQRI